MAGTRGFGGLEPCPVCHVPHDKLHDCSGALWPLRTGIETQKILHHARKLKAGPAEKLLKKNGLRLIDVYSNINYLPPFNHNLECLYDCILLRPSPSYILGRNACSRPWTWRKAPLAHPPKIYQANWTSWTVEG